MARRTRRASAQQPSTPAGRGSEGGEETISEDHVCPVCHLLIYRPVTTRCNHTLCESCMAHWADGSITSQMTIVSLDDEPSTFDPIQAEANCPMCRTPTTASLNGPLAEDLRTRYPTKYPERQAEEEVPEAGGAESSMETLTLYIGNRHRLVVPPRESANQHEWTFFVRPSRTDIIEEVHILLASRPDCDHPPRCLQVAGHLLQLSPNLSPESPHVCTLTLIRQHPTFRPSRVIRTFPPYEICRLGWGYFTVDAFVILKAGYSWVSDDAEPAPDGASKGMLPLQWTLDFDGFNGRGSMGRWRLKVKGEAGWDRTEEDQLNRRGHARADADWRPQE